MVRCMSNTPVVVQNGVTIYSLGSSVRDDDKQRVESFLRSVGICQEMDEYYMDVITGLTGCGPAYVSDQLSVCWCDDVPLYIRCF